MGAVVGAGVSSSWTASAGGESGAGVSSGTGVSSIGVATGDGMEGGSFEGGGAVTLGCLAFLRTRGAMGNNQA